MILEGEGKRKEAVATEAVGKGEEEEEGVMMAEALKR